MIPPERELGPKMRALPPGHQAFVAAMVLTGGNRTQSAALAGYSNSDPEVLRSQGSKLGRTPAIVEALKEEGFRQLHGAQFTAVGVLVEIMEDKFHKDRLKAATAVLNRTGMPEVLERNIKVDTGESGGGAAVLDRLNALARELKIDPQRLMQGELVTIEAEVVGTNEGLEDILS
jgi:phage terminase small subunit